MKTPRKGDKKIKDGCEAVCMAYADGYLIYRFASTYPQIMTLRAWENLPSLPSQKEMALA